MLERDVRKRWGGSVRAPAKGSEDKKNRKEQGEFGVTP